VAGLRQAGLEVELERRRPPRPPGGEAAHTRPEGVLAARHPCFSAAGRYEISAGGRKVVGSAQCRAHGWFMQHGSILLSSGHLNLPRYLGGDDPEREIVELREATVDCSSLLGRPLVPDDLVAPLTAGFARTLGIELEPGFLSPFERDLAERLRTEQFATRSWTREGSRGSGKGKGVSA
jgi:lipoate-protein ligase A